MFHFIETTHKLNEYQRVRDHKPGSKFRTLPGVLGDSLWVWGLLSWKGHSAGMPWRQIGIHGGQEGTSLTRMSTEAAQQKLALLTFTPCVHNAEFESDAVIHFYFGISWIQTVAMENGKSMIKSVCLFTRRSKWKGKNVRWCSKHVHFFISFFFFYFVAKMTLVNDPGIVSVITG